MGWCAINFCDNIWNLFVKYIPKKERKEIALELIKMFEARDMDDGYCESSVEKAAGIKYEDG
ncbi:MAG: hypothetical protein A2Z35_06110 [Actinobacteria bacterium RBG_19FT_COMBO_36_27]|nr:MAG: hypothetical protein A2Z35_06110 [Actinobacteria bacterium RBG_19FT_COMBO_36_27]